jgi:uncharacterized surface protein with fasciclin (FAS1) repeats
LVKAVSAADLVSTLKGAGPFTVFAPTDDAFNKLPKETLAELLKPENKAKLQKLLTYHVVPGKLSAEQVTKVHGVKTVQGEQLDVVVKDGNVTVDGAKVIKTDIVASNGIIHVIDSVIMPADKNIVEVAAASKDFSTLVTAVKAAGLVETLAGEGPFTVFAPTDAAFAKLPKGTIDNLLKPENKQKLVEILSYHVVPGKILSHDAAKSKDAKTVLGKSVALTSKGQQIMVGNANVVGADIEATNGVVHVIDTVLLPQ